jgi:hypothetical protein
MHCGGIDMKKTARILFCDNESKNHALFRDIVVPHLAKCLPDYKLTVNHAQSLYPIYENEYDGLCRRLRGKSVESWIREKQTWDLVVTDIDFASRSEMGTRETGFEILQTVDGKTASRSPWCEFLLISAVAETYTFDKYLNVGRIIRNNPASVITLSSTVAAEDYKRVAHRAEELLRSAMHLESVSRPHVAPDWFNVYLFVGHEEVLLFVRPKHGTEPFKKIINGVAQYSLLGLSQWAKTFGKDRGFVGSHKLTNLAVQRLKESRVDHPAFTQDATRQHMRDIRTIISKEETPLGVAPADMQELGKLHKGTHEDKYICGYCVIYGRTKGAGYAFAGEVTEIRLPDEISVNEAYQDPDKIMKRLAAQMATSAST